MKPFWHTLLLLCCCLHAAATRTILCGEVHNAKSTGTVSIYYYATPLDDIIGSKTSQVVKMENHRYKFVLDIDQPVKVYMQDGEDWLTYQNYIAPGDSLALSFADTSLGFDGNCEDCNYFLYQWTEKFLASKDARSRRESARSLSGLAFAAQSNDDRIASIEFMNAYFKEKKLPPLFRQYFLAEVNYGYAGDLLRKTWGNPELLSDTVYLNYIRKVPIMDEGSMVNNDYTNFLRELPYSSWRAKHNTRDTVVKAYYSRNQYRIRDSVARTYFTGVAYDIALYSIFKDEFSLVEGLMGTPRFEEVYKMAIGDYEARRTAFSTPAYYDKLMSKLRALKEAKPAPDFTLQDITGKKVNLSDFKGKVVYIDFWATNCAPCVAEVSHAKQLMKRFEKEEVVFLFVSIGDNKEVLKKFLADRKFNGIHLTEPMGFGSEVAKLYGISSLPQYVLVDKAGILVNSNPPRPSGNPDELIKAELEKH